MTNWPNYYPADVPPEHASHASGVAYRIVRTIPPSAIDFRSTHEEWTERGVPVPAELLWMACGTSVHTELEGSVATRRRFKPLRNRRIVVGELVAAHGKMLPTQGDHPSHVTVWFYVGSTPELAFTIDAEGARDQ